MRDSLFGEPLEHQILTNNFASGEVPVESSQTGCAEGAPHGTADLAAEAARDTSFVRKQDAFVNLVIPIVNKELVNAISRSFMSCNFERLNSKVLIEVGSQVCREVKHSVEGIDGSLVKMSTDLLATEFGIGSIAEQSLNLCARIAH
jgi:hypothetical protein